MKRQPSRLPWIVLLVAILINVSSSILGTLATFLPMKSVLILGSNEVPSFFPRPVRELDPLWVALLLLIAAGIFSVLSSLGERSTRWLSTALPSSDIRRGHRIVSRRTIRSGATTLFLLTVWALLLYISWIFAVLLILWMLAISGFAVVQEKASDDGRAYPPRPKEFRFGIAGKIKDTALWSSVLLAVLTLIVSEPRFGLTGILLSTVFVRKFQLSFSTLLNLRATDGDTRAFGDRGPAARGASGNIGRLHPLSYFSTRQGLTALRKFLSSRGIGPDDFQILDSKSEDSLTIVAGNSSLPISMTYRILGRRKNAAAEDEFIFRTSDFFVSPYGPSEVSLKNLDGFPIIEIQSERNMREHVSVAQLSQVDIDSWVFTLEKRCLESQEFQFQNRSRADKNYGKSLIDSLERLSVFPGEYQDDCRELVTALRVFSNEIGSGPFVWVPNRALKPSDFIGANHHELEMVAFPGWSLGLLGENWIDSRLPSTNRFQGLISDAEWDLARMRNDLLRLIRSLGCNDGDETSNSLGSLKLALRRLDGAGAVRPHYNSEANSKGAIPTNDP